MKEVDAALDPAHSMQYMKPPTIKCICRLTNDGIGHLINCDACDTAQHFQCYYLNEDGNFSELDEHYCIDCKPRPIDAKMATIRQKDRKKEHLEYLRAVELARDKVKKKDYGPAWLTSRSVVEKELLRPLMRHHGTDWKRIADDIGTSTHVEVCNSVFGIESIADTYRTRSGITGSELLPVEMNNGGKTCSVLQIEVWRRTECS